MNIIYRLLAVATLLIATGVSLQAQEITSQEGRFRAVFPMAGEPSQSTTPVETAAGEISMVTYMATDNKSAAMIAYADYPLEAFEGVSLDVMLDSARAGAMRNLKGKITKRSKITINGHPGQSVYFTGKTGGLTLYGRFDYYIVTPRLFQVGYLSSSAKDVNTAKAKAYFKSFQLIEESE